MGARQSFFDLTEAQRAGASPWQIDMGLPLPPGTWKIGLGVRDEETGEQSLLATCARYDETDAVAEIPCEAPSANDANDR